MVLSELKIGEQAKVLKIDNEISIKNRLTAMGLTEGVKITLIRRAPLSDPVEIKLRGFYMAIRKADADKIYVEKL